MNELQRKQALEKLADFLDVEVADLRGEDGHTPTDAELTALITPLIPAPVKGDNGANGIDGKDGKDYVLTAKDKKEIAKSVEVPVIEKIVERVEVRTEVVKEQPIVKETIKEVIPNDVLDDIESLQEQINDLETRMKKIKGGTTTVFGSSGVASFSLQENIIPTGTINGINTVFVLPTTPQPATIRVYADGVRQTVTTDFTLSGTTITFTVAPTSAVLCDYRI